MKGLRPLLLEDLEIVAPGVKVRRLCLNRHLPETNWVKSHHHDFTQVLFYLSGSGWQTIEEERIPVSTGRLIGIPAGVDHAFVKEKARSPLCLVIDLETDSAGMAPHGSVLLNAEAQTEVQRSLSWLVRHKPNADDVGSRVRECGVILQIVGLLFDCLGEPSSKARNQAASGRISSQRYTTKVRQYLQGQASEDWGGDDIARCLKMQRDHLNRLVKQECGLTTGQLVAEHRLRQARKALVETDREIQSIAAEVGMLDRNYFARWFRKQTGLTPTDWRNRHRRREHG